MNGFHGLLQILTLRCEAAAALLSRQLDEPLSHLERTALVCHLVACRSCRRFHRQVQRIRQALRLRNRLGPADNADDEGLSPEARARIVRAIREAQAIGEPPAGTGPDTPRDETLP